MRIVATILIVSTLSGCAVIDKVSALWPRDHDPALVSGWVTLDTALDKVSCDDKETISTALVAADWLNRYTHFRNDPQKATTKIINENLSKAHRTENKVVCDRFVKLTFINMKTIKESWSGR